MQASLLLDIQAVLVTMALVTPRVLVCLVILPGFGLNVLTGMARNAAAMAIALPAAASSQLPATWSMWLTTPRSATRPRA